MTAAPNTAQTPAASGQLVRGLKLFDATTIIIGSMIGSGIFIVSADIARTLKSPGLLLVSWGIAAVMTILAALSYGELAAAMPHAGGQYVFLREAFGPLFGFLYGWTLFLVIQTGTIAAVVVAFAKFSGLFAPWISASNVLIHFPFGYHLSSQHLTAILVLAFLVTHVAMFKYGWGSRFSNDSQPSHRLTTSFSVVTMASASDSAARPAMRRSSCGR